MAKETQSPDEALYDKAAELAEKHLGLALREAGETEYLVAVMMIEAAVNAAVDLTSPSDIVSLLKDLVRQIEMDIDEDE